MTKDPEARWPYWRATFVALRRGHVVFAQVSRIQGLYLHFKSQVAYLTAIMDGQLAAARKLPPELRQVKEPVESTG